MVVGVEVYAVFPWVEYYWYFIDFYVLLLCSGSINRLLQRTRLHRRPCKRRLRREPLPRKTDYPDALLDQDDILLKNLWTIWPLDLDGYLLSHWSDAVYCLLLFAALVVYLLFLYCGRRGLVIANIGWRRSKPIILWKALSLPIPDIARVPVRPPLQQKHLLANPNQQLWKVRQRNSFQPKDRCVLPVGVVVLDHLFVKHFDDQLHCCCHY